MTSFPETELIVKVNGETVFHVEPLNDEGMGSVLCPGFESDECGIAIAMLVSCLQILTGPRPGPEPDMTVMAIDATGQPKQDNRKGSHLRLVQSEPQS